MGASPPFTVSFDCMSDNAKLSLLIMSIRGSSLRDVVIIIALNRMVTRIAAVRTRHRRAMAMLPASTSRSGVSNICKRMRVSTLKRTTSTPTNRGGGGEEEHGRGSRGRMSQEGGARGREGARSREEGGSGKQEGEEEQRAGEEDDE